MDMVAGHGLYFFNGIVAATTPERFLVRGVIDEPSIYSNAAYGDGRLVFRDRKGHLVCYDLRRK